MKKICIVSLGNLYLAPYLQQYTNILGANYDLVYWDRENLNEKIEGENVNVYRFCRAIKGKATKFISYWLFKIFIKKILKNTKYDCVIFLQTLGAIIVGKFLVKKYKNNYIIDIRDYSYEGNKFIYSIEKKLVENSLTCVISSEGYKKFLPRREYLITHNIRDLDCSLVQRIKSRKKNKEVLNICFIGYVNYHEQHKKLLLKLKNDKRFIISFIGTRALELNDFCKTNGINNVLLIDRFDSVDILKYYENADLVNNLYGNHTPILDYALSNKLYFAAELNIPILTCSDTFMSEISHSYDFGIDVDVDDDSCGDLIFNAYMNIDWIKLENGTERFLKKVKKEQLEFQNTISSLIK